VLKIHHIAKPQRFTKIKILFISSFTVEISNTCAETATSELFYLLLRYHFAIISAHKTPLAFRAPLPSCPPWALVICLPTLRKVRLLLFKKGRKKEDLFLFQRDFL
jgi:hypothetical protein